MHNVFMVSAARTPVGRRNGYLREWKAPELLGAMLDEVVGRIHLDPALVEEVVTGTVYQVGEQGFTIARTGVFASKFPEHVPGISVNRQCGSSLSALQICSSMIATGMIDVGIASGIELMSKYPIGSDVGGTLPDGRPQGDPYGPYLFERVKGKLYNQAQAAQAIAETFGITKKMCDEFAVASHTKAHTATLNGHFKNEIMPTKGLDGEGAEIIRDTDETIRPDTNLDKLAALKPVLGTDWITAGISSPVTDGASAVVLMSEQKVNDLGLTPMARVVANAVVGSDPVLMLTGPLSATPKVLEKAGMKMSDIDIFEVNEAFAPVPLAWAKHLKAPMEKLNVNGGAMALGHPVGNSGCRLTVTAINELIRRKAKYALVTLCTGGAQAPASIFERV
ncbi:MAG: thiolase family protein [Candidatus Abyssobacteria bacterium SURF_5]|uniref:Thiolase family protein n=1 Tax=Abyssobacteria bacterium (strain SURF_5) TaxID=2093360 RepID=A0A3A4NQN0_ABYX5|nr:MAG: thiolase family protein [Candidatus Abyssubacteria bacterium SURF_5]